MMQTSQSFIASQKVSFKGYQRLRESLMQQSALFDSVMTEAQFEPKFSDVVIANAAIGDAANTPEYEAVCFVLMRSPTLSVLLVATPWNASERVFSTQAARNGHVAQNGQALYSQVDIDSIDSQLPQFQAQSEQSAHFVSLTEKPLEPSSARASVKAGVTTSVKAETKVNTESSSTAERLPQYEVKLSFDDKAILSFIEQLTPNRAATGVMAPLTASKVQPEASASDKKMAEVKDLDRDNFVLAWAKQLAISPDGLAQATLDNQVQQSLLLNQVITRIRHSLDLPAILETTVAQVREFLSADRLVLYQFEQIKPVDVSSPSSTTPFAPDVQTSGAQTPGAQSHSFDNFATTDLNTNSDAIIGRCTHEGHITYESRISESIPSVLNLSESACFMPSLSIRSRYIMGQPVAVDDVDKQYAHAECLLDFLHQAQVKSKIIAPIIVKDQLWGLLIAHQCENYRHWQETEVMFLQHIAEHLAVAISQAGLYQQLQKQTVSLESCVVERTQNLHDALLAAESANLTKGEFLSTMSHELRTPLTYIIGMSATLLRWSFGELSDRQRSYLNTINHSGEQLLEIINDILDFAKISSGRTFLDVSEFSMKALVDELVDHFQSIADKQEVTLLLRFDVAPSEDKFQADTKRLRQIISNLIHNAIKFTPAGGQVTVRVLRDGHLGVFQVEDTGIGIPESQRGQLFEKFKQLESPFQRQYSGTGLGLAMTKRLVELHGGTIQVKSEVGQGSIFSVRLPIQTPQRASDRYQVPLTLSDSSKRILLLEVQENSAAIICDLLTADGYEVIWQADVEKMLPQLESLQPAMLIADLSLLSHDVDEIKKVQLSITGMGTRVLALLGQPMSQSSHVAHHDTLEKPIDPKKLLEKVRQLTIPSV